MKLFQTLFNYVICTTKQKHIDETHGLGHAINVLINSHQIFEHEKHNYPEIIPLEPVIYTSSIIHGPKRRHQRNQQTIARKPT